ncbi:MAG: prepilin-type N-terminal cleavage/methylation domain-containing protein [Hydrogenoanaerobacterium sp.]
MNKIIKKKRNESGFTLVEVIVVLVILAILAAISIPALTGYIDEAKDKQLISEARSWYAAAQATASKSYDGKTLHTGGSVPKKIIVDPMQMQSFVGKTIDGNKEKILAYCDPNTYDVTYLEYQNIEQNKKVVIIKLLSGDLDYTVKEMK